MQDSSEPRHFTGWRLNGTALDTTGLPIVTGADRRCKISCMCKRKDDAMYLLWFEREIRQVLFRFVSFVAGRGGGRGAAARGREGERARVGVGGPHRNPNLPGCNRWALGAGRVLASGVRWHKLRIPHSESRLVASSRLHSPPRPCDATSPPPPQSHDATTTTAEPAAMASIPRPRTPIDETLWRDSSFCRVHGVTQHMGMPLHLRRPLTLLTPHLCTQ